MVRHPAFAFGPFELQVEPMRLTKNGEPVALSARHLDLLFALVARAGQIVSKDQLITAGWRDVAVTDNSLEQAISTLRRALSGTGAAYIETHPRRGYRFAADVSRRHPRQSDDVIDALLAPHRAWIEGRAALETLEREQILHAQDVFAQALTAAPHQSSGHVGMANACALHFEMTRAEQEPQVEMLLQAAGHAREACRLDPENGEAWATLGFVLERTGHRGDALAALRRAVALEPDNWRHHVRLSYGSWGEERLRAARRTLGLLPGFAMAHWLAATVQVARQAFAAAEREIAAGLAAQAHQADTGRRFSAVALHYLAGLLHMRRGDDAAALAAFERELATEVNGHLYARECCANTYYAVGVLHLRHGHVDAAAAALTETLARIPTHPLARIVLAHAGFAPGAPSAAHLRDAPRAPRGLEAAFIAAATLVLNERVADAAAVVEEALDRAEPGSAGWLLPVEPVLQPAAAPDLWAGALARLRARAA